jgi:hypothetical protein
MRAAGCGKRVHVVCFNRRRRLKEMTRVIRDILHARLGRFGTEVGLALVTEDTASGASRKGHPFRSFCQSYVG